MTTKVVNKHKFDVKRSGQDAVYIGRGSPWGNPYMIGKDGTREEVIEKYRDFAIRHAFPTAAKLILRGKILVCFCKPLPCHGDLLAEWADAE